MIITITGELGSGKSTIAKRLAETLQYETISIGQLRRDAAKRRGMTIEEYNKFGENSPETDIEVDEYQKKLGNEKDNFIIEGRTSWFLIPHSIKLYFKVDPLEGAQRIFKELQGKNSRNEGHHIQTIEDLLESNIKRMASDKFRYQKYYQKDCFNEANFDYIIDTTLLSPDEVLEKALTYLKEKMNA